MRSPKAVSKNADIAPNLPKGRQSLVLRCQQDDGTSDRAVTVEGFDDVSFGLQRLHQDAPLQLR